MSFRSTPYSRLFHLRSRRSLIVATITLQAVVAGCGLWGTLQFARSSMVARIRDQVTEQNARAVSYLSGVLSETTDKPLRVGSPEWQEAQRLIEGFQLPSHTGLAILTDSGEVLRPSESSRANRPPKVIPSAKMLANTVVTLLPGHETMFLRELNPGTVVIGEADWMGEESYIAVLDNDRIGAKIVAFQTRAAVIAAERQFLDSVFFWSSLLVMLVLSITTLGLVLLVGGYDTIVMRFNRKLEEEVERRTRRGLAIRNGLIFGLAKLADYRDTDTGRHLERICRYCEMLATQLLGSHPEIDRAWIERLKLASSMHDIGKVGIPDSILLKPGMLNREERIQMESHASIGADTLLAIRDHVGDDDLLNMSVQVALSHHERYDGTGYPAKLAGEQIPLCARIVALADVYDALTSRRVYKAPMSHEKAREIIEQGRGTHFDPTVTDAFLAIHAQFDAARSQLQSESGEAELPTLQLAVQQAETARLGKAAA